MKGKQIESLPTSQQLEGELNRENLRRRYRRMVRSTISVLVVVAAAAVLVSTTLLPVLRVYGYSMEPTLTGGDVVVSWRIGSIGRGDIIAFHYNNKILIKRVIGLPGEWIDIDEAGNVSVDGVPLEEPYLTEKALGACDITLPYQVPEGRYFVLGDHRGTSSDSRNTALGCVSEEQILGRLVFRVWPFDKLGTVS